MKPPGFEYFAPTTLDECLELLDHHGDKARVLAGGQSLVPLMNRRLALPSVLVDLNRIEDMAYVREADGCLAIGAMTRHHDVATSQIVTSSCPLLAHAVSLIGFPAIRFRGTLGGSLAHADPVSEIPCVAVALEAELVVASRAGRRSIPADDFFLGTGATALLPGEVVIEVRFPDRRGGGWGFQEFGRKSTQFTLAAVAVHLDLADGALSRVSVGLAGVSDRPLRGRTAEDLLIDEEPTTEVLRSAAFILAAEVEELNGIHASLGYRRQLVAVLGERALTDAVQLAEGAT